MMDPITLEDLFDRIVKTTDGHRSLAIRTLYTVVHNEAVKVRLTAAPEALAAVATTLHFLTPIAHEVRWETLAVIGEVCRRESSKDSDRAKVLNTIADECTAIVCGVPGLSDVLKSIAADDSNNDLQDMALDLLRALPLDGEAFSGERRARCRELLFLDPTVDGTVPLVCVAAHLVCKECGAAPAEGRANLLRCAACKGVFYCTAACQKASWKVSHKTVCKGKGPGLFHVTRKELYEGRCATLNDVTYSEYFFQFSV